MPHFFFPEMAKDIDWSKGYRFLDKELQQIAKDSELGRRFAHTLAEIHRLSGEDQWLLTHVEIQGQKQGGFPKRMYVYNYRGFDRFDRKVKNLADIEAFLFKCKYMSDRKTRSQSDFWEPPDEFEKRRTGDCEDHAIWAWRHLHDMGYKARLVLGNYRRWHAWVHIFVNGRAYLLEATQKDRWFPQTDSYDAWWSVERIGNKKFAFFLHSGDKDLEKKPA